MEVKRHTARKLAERMSSFGDATELSEAIAEIRLLSKHDAEIRLPLTEAGVVPLLIQHLVADLPITSPFSRENASAALLNLSISAREPLMSTPGLLDALSHCINPSSPGPVAQNAATTVFSLLSVDAYRPIIGSKKSLLSALIALLHDPGTEARTAKDALKALFGIAIYTPNRPTMVDLGVVPVLFSLVSNDDRSGVVENATAVIAKVSGCYESFEACRREAGVRVLLGLVDKGTKASERTRENAVAALLNLALSGGEAAVSEILKEDSAIAVVRELAQAGISTRATSKAEELLKILAKRQHSRVESHWIRDFDLLELSPPQPDSSADSACSAN